MNHFVCVAMWVVYGRHTHLRTAGVHIEQIFSLFPFKRTHGSRRLPRKWGNRGKLRAVALVVVGEALLLPLGHSRQTVLPP